jgi:hypothetical protein
MSDFIVNPRRAPRAAVPLTARATVLSGRYWRSPTADCGPGGCQLVAGAPCAPGERIFLELADGPLPEPAWLTGKVAWVAGAGELRIGVEYDAHSLPAGARLYALLAGAAPASIVGGRAPRAVPLGARVAPGMTPDAGSLLPREAELFAAVGDGTTVRALRERLGGRWEALVHPLFALLDRSQLVVVPGADLR